jgi:hypothetical protein
MSELRLGIRVRVEAGGGGRGRSGRCEAAAGAPGGGLLRVVATRPPIELGFRGLRWQRRGNSDELCWSIEVVKGGGCGWPDGGQRCHLGGGWRAGLVGQHGDKTGGRHSGGRRGRRRPGGRSQRRARGRDGYTLALT